MPLENLFKNQAFHRVRSHKYSLNSFKIYGLQPIWLLIE